MTYEEAEARVHAFTRFGSQLGLGRMRRLLGLLGNPQDRLRYVHIAGTNGKGTTANLTAAILRQAGYRTGLYTSPFVVEFRERYQIDGEMISREEFTGLVEEILPRVEELAAAGENVTEFEMVTAVGFLWFARRNCDIVVLEVGLGGRFDATNVIHTPECAVITAIGLDHTAILGDTLEQIAGEKAGIIKEGSDVVSWPMQAPEALSVLLERCAETGSRLHLPHPAGIEILETGETGSRFCVGGQEYRLGMAGTHQIYNAAVVLEVVRVLQSRGFGIPEEAVSRGLSETAVPARFQILRREPLVVVDGAHNPQAAAALAGMLDGLAYAPRIAILGMMRDKDCAAVAQTIGSRCQTVLCLTVPGHPRALPAGELAAIAEGCCQDVRTAASPAEALELGTQLAGRTGMVIVCGSFYLATEFLKREEKP